LALARQLKGKLNNPRLFGMWQLLNFLNDGFSSHDGIIAEFGV